MPAARIAVISPSLDIRERAISVPTRTPRGSVSGMVAGNKRTKRYPTVAGVVELLTRMEKSCPAFCRKRTKTNRTAPRDALAAISATTTRDRIPMEVRRARHSTKYGSAETI
jgi:hypothetical protein